MQLDELYEREALSTTEQSTDRRRTPSLRVRIGHNSQEPVWRLNNQSCSTNVACSNLKRYFPLVSLFPCWGWSACWSACWSAGWPTNKPGQINRTGSQEVWGCISVVAPVTSNPETWLVSGGNRHCAPFQKGPKDFGPTYTLGHE
jgi:hypothetical protein